MQKKINPKVFKKNKKEPKGLNFPESLPGGEQTPQGITPEDKRGPTDKENGDDVGGLAKN